MHTNLYEAPIWRTYVILEELFVKVPPPPPPLSRPIEGAPCNPYPGSQLPDGRPVLQGGSKAVHLEGSPLHAGETFSSLKPGEGGSCCRGQAG